MKSKNPHPTNTVSMSSSILVLYTGASALHIWPPLGARHPPALPRFDQQIDSAPHGLNALYLNLIRWNVHQQIDSLYGRCLLLIVHVPGIDGSQHGSDRDRWIATEAARWMWLAVHVDVMRRHRFNVKAPAARRTRGSWWWRPDGRGYERGIKKPSDGIV